MNNHLLLSSINKNIIELQLYLRSEGNESTGVMQWQMPNQREQYGGTVHLFIGAGHNPHKITFVPFTLDNNSIVICRGLNSLFILK